MPKSRLPASFSTGRRWSESDARVALAAVDASGLTLNAFAAREGLAPQRLYFWKRRLEGPREAVAAPPAFVEVRRRAAEPVEIVLRSGRILRVSESIDANALHRLIAALEQEPGC